MACRVGAFLLVILTWTDIGNRRKSLPYTILCPKISPSLTSITRGQSQVIKARSPTPISVVPETSTSNRGRPAAVFLKWRFVRRSHSFTPHRWLLITYPAIRSISIAFSLAALPSSRYVGLARSCRSPGGSASFAIVCPTHLTSRLCLTRFPLRSRFRVRAPALTCRTHQY